MQCRARILVGILVFLSGVAPGRADALHEAVLAGDAKAVSSLLAAGADVNALDALGTPLHMAALTGDAAVAGLLIDAGADIEAVTPPEAERPLHTAARSGKVAVAVLLIARKADVSAR